MTNAGELPVTDLSTFRANRQAELVGSSEAPNQDGATRIEIIDYQTLEAEYAIGGLKAVVKGADPQSLQHACEAISRLRQLLLHAEQAITTERQHPHKPFSV